MSDRALLLVAGPLALSDREATRGDLAGAGAIAAIAAAGIADVQLWARGGDGIDARVREVLTRRRVDCAGVGWHGATPCELDHGELRNPPYLPELAPTSADGVGAAAVIGLVGDEQDRALRIIRGLPKGDARPLIVWSAERDARSAALSAADIWITAAEADPLAQARALQRAGPTKCVIVTAGMLGGLIVYGDKATTYGALPETGLAPSAAGPAFAGVLAAWIAGKGKADFSAIKRAAAMGSAVAGVTRLGPPARKLLSLGAKEYHERFNKLRRIGKF